jgi:uncharacterized protein
MPRRTKAILAIMCSGLLLYFVLSPMILAYPLLYAPQKFPAGKYDIASVAGVEKQDVSFRTAKGKSLHGWYFEYPKSKYVVIINHPQGGNVAIHVGLASTLLATGNSVLIYDYEGFGKSEGDPSTQALLDDGLAAYDFIANKKMVPANQIVEFGFSLGTGVASYVVAHRKCAALILVSPYVSLKQTCRDYMPLLHLYPDAMFPQPDLTQDEMLKSNSTVPLLIVHGAKDKLIPLRDAQQLLDAAKCSKKLVIDPSTHHGDYKLAFLSTTIRSFLDGLK